MITAPNPLSDRQNSFEDKLRESVANALKRLLSEKHLYQSVQIDTACADSEIERLMVAKARSFGPSVHQHDRLSVEKEVHADVHAEWFLDPAVEGSPGARPLRSVAKPETELRLPIIECFCAEKSCDQRRPFHAVPGFCKIQTASEVPNEQWLFLSYQCQACTGTPVRFLVRRSGCRVTLSGRDPMEVVQVPKVIPRAHVKHFRDAIIAHQSGQTLAGLFLLRVFIESYWKCLDPVSNALAKNVRPSGDEFGAVYNSTLPTDFKSRFPSLPEVYSNLSAGIHRANPSAELFQQSHDMIVEHFDALRLFKMVRSGEIADT